MLQLLLFIKSSTTTFLGLLEAGLLCSVCADHSPTPPCDWQGCWSAILNGGFRDSERGGQGDTDAPADDDPARAHCTCPARQVLRARRARARPMD